MKEEISVIQLANYVSKQTTYHHSEDSLCTTRRKFYGSEVCESTWLQCLRLNMNLTPVTNIPWKLCNFMSCVTQSQNHLCQYQSDLLFHFWGNCVNLHLPTTIRKHVHTQKKLVIPAWNLLLFLHGPSIIITWVMQLSMLYNHHEQTSQ